ncbi:hypothetical protein [Nocardioides panaciterrulae]|nr:hypothetical protein [Nocardioides panaciterrulae]
MDIRDEIDRSFGSGPNDGATDAEIERLLAAGHRALRRRRLAVAGAALTTAAVVGGTAWAAAGAGSDRADDAPVASSSGATRAADPSTAATPSTGPTSSPTGGPGAERTPSNAELDHVLHELSLVAYDDAGNVVVDDRATVVQRLANPFHLDPPQKSVGVAVRFHGVTYWYALNYAGDGSSSGTLAWAGGQQGSFLSWVQGASGTVSGPESVGDPVLDGIASVDLVRFVGDTEQLEPVRGATILEQRAHVRVGDSFAGPGDHTAAAEVAGGDGERYYVLARSFDGKPGQYIAIPVKRGGASLDDFLALARQRYAGGGAEGGGGLK